jgi:hypothetical protein
MRRWLALSLPVVALLARPVLAEDAKTYTIPAHETWKVGDVLSKHEVDKKSQKRNVKDPQGNPIPGAAADESESTTYDAVLKVLEVDGEGRFTHAMVFVKSWTHEQTGKPADTSLAGKHVEVTGVGADRKATVVSGAAEVSPKGIEWVADEFGKKSGQKEAKGEILAPGKPVAIGESWSPDTAKLLALFSDEGGPNFVAEGTSATFTLVDVKDGHAEMKLEFVLQSGPMQTPNGPLEWKEGGAVKLTGTGTKALDAGDHTGSNSMTGSFAGVGALGPVTVEIDSTFGNEMTVTAGGEMPATK